MGRRVRSCLDPRKVKRARDGEKDYVREMGLYDKVPISECSAKTGKAPIGTKRLDINKFDDKDPSLMFV